MLVSIPDNSCVYLHHDPILSHGCFMFKEALGEGPDIEPTPRAAVALQQILLRNQRRY
jgi:hypothetical protein